MAAPPTDTTDTAPAEGEKQPESEAPASPSSAAEEPEEEAEEEEEDPEEPEEEEEGDEAGAEEAEEEADEEEEETPSSAAVAAEGGENRKWPGWPGDNVFRMIVPVVKVGSIIGRKGEFIKKLCEETRARIRILDGPIGTTDRIVLISGREELEAELSPAMNAVLKVFKRVNGMDSGADGATPKSSVPTVCAVRLLVASSQAINLIGKQGASIKSIQENSNAVIRILSGDERPFYATSDERVVEIQGESSRVLIALEAVVGHLRKFLVDHSVLPLFEKNYNSTVTQEQAGDAWSDRTQSTIHPAQQSVIGNEYSRPVKRDSLYLEREHHLDSQISRTGLSLYGQDPALSGLRSSGAGRPAGALVTQITQTMQIPLSYAEDIIGIGGGNISYIRATSGAVLTVQESRVVPDEITVEIKGTSSQVQTAQQLIQDFIAGHKEPARSSYGGLDAGYRSSYSQLGSATYPSSSLASHSLGGYGSSGYGGYGGGYRY